MRFLRIFILRVLCDRSIYRAKCALILTHLFLVVPASSYAFSLTDWNLALSAGFGGAGISKQVEIEETVLDVSRSEGPLMLGVGLETALHDRLGFVIEHRRGLQLGPLSSGVGFTGVGWRWYFLRDMAALPKSKMSEFAAIKRWVPFAGLSTGFAAGEIKRPREIAPVVNGSGAYLGIRLGLDYHYKTHLILRPEITSSTTFFNSGKLSQTVSEFSLLCGLIFRPW